MRNFGCNLNVFLGCFFFFSLRNIAIGCKLFQNAQWASIIVCTYNSHSWLYCNKVSGRNPLVVTTWVVCIHIYIYFFGTAQCSIIIENEKKNIIICAYRGKQCYCIGILFPTLFHSWSLNIILILYYYVLFVRS